jgi:hypothetical protein
LEEERLKAAGKNLDAGKRKKKLKPWEHLEEEEPELKTIDDEGTLTRLQNYTPCTECYCFSSGIGAFPPVPGEDEINAG